MLFLSSAACCTHITVEPFQLCLSARWAPPKFVPRCLPFNKPYVAVARSQLTRLVVQLHLATVHSETTSCGTLCRPDTGYSLNFILWDMLTASELVVLLAGLSATASGYFVSIDAHAEECFYERVNSGTKMGLMFEVAEGGFLDIGVEVRCSVPDQDTLITFVCPQSLNTETRLHGPVLS